MMTDSTVRGPDRSALGSLHLKGRPCPARPPAEPDAETTVLLTGPPTGTHPQGPGMGRSSARPTALHPCIFLFTETQSFSVYITTHIPIRVPVCLGGSIFLKGICSEKHF